MALGEPLPWQLRLRGLEAPPEGMGVLAPHQGRAGVCVSGDRNCTSAHTLLGKGFVCSLMEMVETSRHHFWAKQDFSQEVCRPDTLLLTVARGFFADNWRNLLENNKQ